MIRKYKKNEKCFYFWLSENTYDRRQRNYFSFRGDQLLENAI